MKNIRNATVSGDTEWGQPGVRALSKVMAVLSISIGAVVALTFVFETKRVSNGD